MWSCHRIKATFFCLGGMSSMISRACSSAIAFSARAAVSDVAPWYLARMSGCLRRKASLRRKSLMSLLASVPSSQARCWLPARLRNLVHALCRRLERVLDQICGKLAIATSAQERVAEQPPVMSYEERAQLSDVTLREPHLAATVHAAPPAALRPGWLRLGCSELIMPM